MKVEEILFEASERGIVITPKIHVRGPSHAITPDFRQAIEQNKGAILSALHADQDGVLDMHEALDHSRRLKKCYVDACLELAETVGWPRLQFTQPVRVTGGEALWRLFLKRADVLTLRDAVIPKLKKLVEDVCPP